MKPFKFIRNLFVRIFCRIQLIRFVPHIIVYYTFRDQDLLNYERDMYLSKFVNGGGYKGVLGFLKLLSGNYAYRSLFYWRTDSDWLNIFARGEVNLHFVTPSAKVGKGLMIWHGYSTIINAASIGENFQIWHNVTIGKKYTSDIPDKPIIGNNVSVCTGSVCLGNINIGNNSIVAANATVVKDIPDNSLVVSQPVRIIEREK